MHLYQICIYIFIISMNKVFTNPGVGYMLEGTCYAKCFFKLSTDSIGDNGIDVENVDNKYDCGRLCLGDAACLAYSWDEAALVNEQCIHSDVATSTADSGVEHYEMMCKCDIANAEPCPYDQFTGVKVGSGTLVSSAGDVSACLQYCDANPDCQGVDWETDTNNCYINTVEGLDANTKTVDSTYDHYKRLCSCEPDVCDPVLGGIDAPQGWSSCAGFKSVHLSHESVTDNGVATGEECLEICQEDSDCHAIDYDVSNEVCYTHSSLTACSDTTEESGFQHIIKPTAPCVPDCCITDCDPMPESLSTGNNGFTDVDLNSWSSCIEKKISGGTDEGMMTAQACYDLCAADAECFAVDYNVDTETCYTHDTVTACDALEDATEYQHAKKYSSPCLYTEGCCVDSSFEPGHDCDLIDPSIYNNFNPGVLTVPSGWTICNTNHVYDGDLISTNNDLTGDECLKECELDSECLSFDYNIDFGECWFHYANSACTNTVLHDEAVQHVQKPSSPCIDSLGGMTCCVVP